MSKTHLFTSESVSEGHPDKLADQISDAVLDACLSEDPESHVACETFVTTGLVLVGGEISTTTYVDIQEIARDVAKRVGYDDPAYGLDYQSMSVLNAVHAQSADIAQGVDGTGLSEYAGLQGAGDQGMMFGYACKETEALMPAPITFAHRILLEASRLRKNGEIRWLRPDSKSQVTVRYEDESPVAIDAVVVSHQHDPDVTHQEICDTVLAKIIRPVLEPTGLLCADTRFYVNPTGRFVIGGPHGDAGLTGRKIIVDTYGGMGRHGGGAFSGKDPSKVDRSAAYMARYVAKNIVAADLADRAELQVSYAIGVPHPVSVSVNTFGTARASEQRIAHAVEQTFDLTPRGIVDTLDLKHHAYRDTASYGHFGRDRFRWEHVDRIADLQAAVG